MEKTNVMRILDRSKIPYEGFRYSSELTEGTLIADTLGEDRRLVYKTLVTEASAHEHYVFVIPVEDKLDLKAAAKAVGVKSLSMLKQKELLPLTGYIHGGCSPIGMKKQFTTVIDSSAEPLDSFFIIAGKVGRQIRISPNSLADLINAKFSKVTV